MRPAPSPLYSLLYPRLLFVLVYLLYAYVLAYHTPRDTWCPETVRARGEGPIGAPWFELNSTPINPRQFYCLYVKTS